MIVKNYHTDEKQNQKQLEKIYFSNSPHEMDKVIRFDVVKETPKMYYVECTLGSNYKHREQVRKSDIGFANYGSTFVLVNDVEDVILRYHHLMMVHYYNEIKDYTTYLDHHRNKVTKLKYKEEVTNEI